MSDSMGFPLNPMFYSPRCHVWSTSTHWYQYWVPSYVSCHQKYWSMKKTWICQKCKYIFDHRISITDFNRVVKPQRCGNPDVCNNTHKFSIVSNSGGSAGGNVQLEACKDYQEIKIQEQVEKLCVGRIPQSLWAVLEDDLVDQCKPGDDVILHGVLLTRWAPLLPDVRAHIELVLYANNVVVTNDKSQNHSSASQLESEFQAWWGAYGDGPLEGRNQILRDLCPQVYGLYVVKMAVMLVLIGGVQRVEATGTHIRGQCHLLLVGDPGTGKSQFLKYARRLLPERSVLTSGVGTTSAGLTCSAVKDGGQWQLEAGALVLADGGLCCIDEFGGIGAHDRASIHEAMEQQTISVAKAGLVCKLNSRCTVLAATNPKGHYDVDQPLTVNVALASPLLSRFDLVLVLLDTKCGEWDELISRHVVDDIVRSAAGAAHGRDSGESCERGEPQQSWGMQKLRAYITSVQRITPTMSEHAQIILESYYRFQRSSDHRNAARTTIRLLESMIRLAQAHARLMYRKVVLVQDALCAVALMETSMQSAALLGSVNVLHSSFPTDPHADYRKQVDLVLAKLQLFHIREEELARLGDCGERETAAWQSTTTEGQGQSHDEDGRGDGVMVLTQATAPRFTQLQSAATAAANPHRPATTPPQSGRDTAAMPGTQAASRRPVGENIIHTLQRFRRRRSANAARDSGDDDTPGVTLRDAPLTRADTGGERTLSGETPSAKLGRYSFPGPAVGAAVPPASRCSSGRHSAEDSGVGDSMSSEWASSGAVAAPGSGAYGGRNMFLRTHAVAGSEGRAQGRRAGNTDVAACAAATLRPPCGTSTPLQPLPPPAADKTRAAAHFLALLRSQTSQPSQHRTATTRHDPLDDHHFFTH